MDTVKGATGYFIYIAQIEGVGEGGGGQGQGGVGGGVCPESNITETKYSRRLVVTM